MNTIRLPFNYRLFESDQNPYKYDSKGFIQIDRLLKLCEKFDIYVIKEKNDSNAHDED